jgi:hypothetical protein
MTQAVRDVRAGGIGKASSSNGLPVRFDAFDRSRTCSLWGEYWARFIATRCAGLLLDGVGIGVEGRGKGFVVASDINSADRENVGRRASRVWRVTI